MICTTAFALSVMSAKPFLSPVFSDHMVLQRDKPNRIWGWANPGETVSIRIADSQAKGAAGPDGKWMIEFKPPATGGPYTLEVKGRETLTLNDVMVGDVWLCSGQSNMEMGLTMGLDPEKNVWAADLPRIRLMLTDHQTGYVPKDEPKGAWKVCSPTTVKEGGWGGFSAVAFHFGRALQAKLHVPIGLVQAAWGGSAAECWVSGNELKKLKDFDDDLDMIGKRSAAGLPENPYYFENWLEEHDPGSVPKTGYMADQVDVTGWKALPFPVRPKDLGMGDSGVVWARASFDLDSLPSHPLYLHFGRIVGSEAVWVNGHQTVSWGGDWDRWYEFPASALRTGKNVVAIRFVAHQASDGILGEGGDRSIDVDGKKVNLESTLLFKGTIDPNIQPQPKNWNPYPSMPTVTRNGMIAPLAPLSLRGAIWYQGESNVGRAPQYRGIMKALIADWRQAFRNPNMPFYQVALAGYTPHRDEPGEDDWAELREAQWLVTRDLKHTGIALATDVGDANDIHPKDKESVGKRLAALALADEYGLKEPSGGPVFAKAEFKGTTARVHFSHTVGVLVLKGPQDQAFQVAGPEKKWRWARATLEGNVVVVTASDGKPFDRLRYAWQACPQTPLYNAAGFPAVPFRTDAVQ